MPEVKEFYHLNIKKMERSDTITLGTLAHFRHFRHSFYILASNCLKAFAPKIV